ncbi:MAG: hypothetical protein WCQ21_23095 [Verrucomicrobiota bacterium]
MILSFGAVSDSLQLLKDWPAQDPGADLAKWGADLFAGRPGPWPTSLPDLSCRIRAGIARAGLHSEPLPRQ